MKVNKKTVIGEFLIVGGDDVCAVFPADLAIEISSKFQKQFEERNSYLNYFDDCNY